MEHEWRAPESEADAPGLRWPPPGLERLQGDLGSIARSGALAGGLLVLPLLFIIARTQAFATLGPLADAWWLTPILATVGLGFGLDALIRTHRLLRRATWAIRRGYDWATLAFVVADGRRDTGFLLQGGRHFSTISAEERRMLARLRVMSVGAHAAAGLWLCVVLGLGLVVAARGWLSPGLLWKVTLVPPLLAYAVGIGAGLVEDRRVRKARRAWYDRPWANDLATGEIRAWRTHLTGGLPTEHPDERGAKVARWGAVAAVVGVVVVAVPVLSVVPTSAVGPILTVLAAPRLETIQDRVAEAEAYRTFRVEVDPGVSAGEAGRILQTLMFVGSARPVGPGEKEPPVRVPRPWLPEVAADAGLLSMPQRWPEELFSTSVATAPELASFLDSVATHPAHADFARLARAATLDVASARWEDPFPAGTTLASVPIPRFGELRTGAYAHLAWAARALAGGREGEAEEAIREVLSLGFLLQDDGPTLIDNLIGDFMVREGGRAFESFYRATSRTRELAELQSLRDVAGRAASRIHVGPSDGPEALVRSLPGMVRDTTALRGLRWEHFTILTTLMPCLNLHRIVFGPDPAYDAFLDEAHDLLVRWPSEEGLFLLAKGGYLAPPEGTDGGFVGALLGLAMRSGDGACGQVVRRFATLRSIL